MPDARIDVIDHLLICTDLDRTLIPNGEEPESPGARTAFSSVVGRSEVYLAYVSGRSRELVEHAIDEYDLPVPDWVLADVGTTLYEVRDGLWSVNADWQARLSRDWPLGSYARAEQCLADVPGITLQDPSRQTEFKLSYVAPAEADSHSLRVRVEERLESLPFPSRTVWSRDEEIGIGLLDVLPRAAGKRAAVDFLRQRLGRTLTQTFFAGDSGNDLDVLASEIPAVLVANASEPVRRLALQEAESRGNRAALYLARGSWRGFNGNYAGGVLEGLCHFVPAAGRWIP